MKLKPDYMLVAVQVRKDHVARLDKIGKESGVPRSFLVREAIAEYLASHEQPALDNHPSIRTSEASP